MSELHLSILPYHCHRYPHLLFSTFEHSHPFVRSHCSSPWSSPCSTPDPTGSRITSRASLAPGRLTGRTWWPWWILWPWLLVPLVLLTGGPGLAAAQVAQAPCATGSAPSGPGGVCVACVAGSFCPDGWTLPLPCPPGTVLFNSFLFYI